MVMPGRKYAAATAKYRYGFNGKENDNDVKGDGNQQDYGMRIYDNRIGRWLSVDPLSDKFTSQSSYNYCFNNPIALNDPSGMSPEPPKKNIYIILNDKKSNFQINKDLEENGWHGIVGNNITDASNKLKKYLGKTQAENIVIDTHGGFGYHTTKTINGKGDVIKTDILKSSGISLGANSTNLIDGNELEMYKDEKTRVALSTVEQNDIKGLLQIANSVSTGKNLILGSCNSGSINDFGKQLSELVTNTIDIFANGDFSRPVYRLVTPATKSNKQLLEVTFRYTFNRNISDETSKEYGDGWKKFNKENKEPEKYRNLMINKAGPKVTN